MNEHFFRGKRIVVSGGLGFIGSNLARRLVDFDAQVTVVDNYLPHHGANDFNLDGYLRRVNVAIQDIRDSDFLKILEPADIYFDLAGQTSHIGSMLNPRMDLEINSQAQLQLLEFVRSHHPSLHIIFTSTRQVYGRPQYLPVDESHPLQPVDINGINKLAAEHYFRLYAEIYGLRTSILRLTNTYGPRMRIANSIQPFLGLWIRRLIDGQPIEVWDGQIVRDFTYVEDAVNALLALACSHQCAGQIFNLGGEKTTLGELSKQLVEYWGQGEVIFTAYPPERKKIEIGSIYSNDQKIRTLLGWQPTTSLADGMQKTLAYYRLHFEEYTHEARR